jgi:hypothetical protein
MWRSVWRLVWRFTGEGSRSFTETAVDGFMRVDGGGVRAISYARDTGCVVLRGRGFVNFTGSGAGFDCNRRFHPVYLYGLPLLMVGQIAMMSVSLKSWPGRMKVAHGISGM